MEIIAQLAQDRVVEGMVATIPEPSLSSDDRKDLCQIVYLALLEYRDDMIQDLWASGQIRFLLYRIIKNQYHTRHSSPFYNKFVKWRERKSSLDGFDIADEDSL